MSTKSTSPAPINGSCTLSEVDIKQAILQGDIYISPYHESNLTSVSYNFNPSRIILSTKEGIPLKIYSKNNTEFVYVRPHDTILVTTEECLFVSAQICGTFHSKVKIVAQGFSHISTTLDPNWRGPLLIALTNCTNKKKRFYIQNEEKTVSFVSLIFQRLKNEPQKQHDNPPNRIDILKEYLAQPKFLPNKLREEYNLFVKDIALSHKNVNDIDNSLSTTEQQIKQCMYKMKIDLGNKSTSVESTVDLDEIIQAQKNVPTINPLLLPLLEDIQAQDIDTDSGIKAIYNSIETTEKLLRYESLAKIWRSVYDQKEGLFRENTVTSTIFRILHTSFWVNTLKYILWIVFVIFVIFYKDSIMSATGMSSEMFITFLTLSFGPIMSLLGNLWSK